LYLTCSFIIEQDIFYPVVYIQHCNHIPLPGTHLMDFMFWNLF